MEERYTKEQKTILQNLSIAIKIDEQRYAVSHPAKMITEKRGSLSGCLRSLLSHHLLKSIYAWAAHGDLQSFKWNAYVATKIHYIHSVEVEAEAIGREGEYFYALFSDCEPLIQWMIGLAPLNSGQWSYISKVGDSFYRQYQMTLALRGDWPQLIQRCETFLRGMPKGMKRFAVDFRFYLALANGDLAGMRASLTELTSPKVAKVRNEVFELAFACDFVGCHATMYAKIARRHGYVIDIQTPLIPPEWLPLEPLPEYRDPYPFMEQYAI